MFGRIIRIVCQFVRGLSGGGFAFFAATALFLCLGGAGDNGIPKEITERPDEMPTWLLAFMCVFAAFGAVSLFMNENRLIASGTEFSILFFTEVLVVVMLGTQIRAWGRLIEGKPEPVWFMSLGWALLFAAPFWLVYWLATVALRRVQKKFAPVEQQLTAMLTKLEAALKEAPLKHEGNCPILKALQDALTGVRQTCERLKQAISHNQLAEADTCASMARAAVQSVIVLLTAQRPPACEQALSAWAAKWRKELEAI